MQCPSPHRKLCGYDRTSCLTASGGTGTRQGEASPLVYILLACPLGVGIHFFVLDLGRDTTSMAGERGWCPSLVVMGIDSSRRYADMNVCRYMHRRRKIPPRPIPKPHRLSLSLPIPTLCLPPLPSPPSPAQPSPARYRPPKTPAPLPMYLSPPRGPPTYLIPTFPAPRFSVRASIQHRS